MLTKVQKNVIFLLMKWPFSIKSSKKTRKKSSDSEKEPKKIARSLLSKELKDAEGNDRREIIGQILGLKLKPKETKTLEEQVYEEALAEDPEYRQAIKQAKIDSIRGKVNPQQELEVILVQSALDAIDKDPDLKNKAVNRKINQIMGGQNSNTALGELLDELDKVEELKERFGGGQQESGGVLSTLAREAMANLPAILSFLGASPPNGGKLPQTPTYVVERPDGGLVQLNAAEFQTYQKQKQIPAPDSVPEVSDYIPQPEAPTAEETPVSSPDDEDEYQKRLALADSEAPPEEPKEEKKTLGMEGWLPYLDDEPSSFAYMLHEMATGGDEQSITTMNYLANSSIDQILQMLDMFKDTAEGDLKLSIDRILNDKTEWLQEVMRLVVNIQGGEVNA